MYVPTYIKLIANSIKVLTSYIHISEINNNNADFKSKAKISKLILCSYTYIVNIYIYTPDLQVFHAPMGPSCLRKI